MCAGNHNAARRHGQPSDSQDAFHCTSSEPYMQTTYRGSSPCDCWRTVILDFDDFNTSRSDQWHHTDMASTLALELHVFVWNVLKLWYCSCVDAHCMYFEFSDATLVLLMHLTQLENAGDGSLACSETTQPRLFSLYMICYMMSRQKGTQRHL
jgi:hypothetical protein